MQWWTMSGDLHSVMVVQPLSPKHMTFVPLWTARCLLVFPVLRSPLMSFFPHPSSHRLFPLIPLHSSCCHRTTYDACYTKFGIITTQPHALHPDLVASPFPFTQHHSFLQHHLYHHPWPTNLVPAFLGLEEYFGCALCLRHRHAQYFLDFLSISDLFIL